MEALKFVINNKTEENLRFLIKAYSILINSYFFLIKSIIDFSKYNENKLRNELVKEADKSNNIGFRFITEYPDLNKNSRIDIKLITPNSLNDKENDIEIECKIVGESKYIDDKKSFLGKTPTNGIMSFITGKYAEKMPFAGMIGFIKEGFISDKLNKLKDILKKSTDIVTIQDLDYYEIDKTFNYSYTSTHKRDGSLGNINIYHLFFDFNKKIV